MRTFKREATNHSPESEGDPLTAICRKGGETPGFSWCLRKRQNVSRIMTLTPPFSFCLWNLIIIMALWAMLGIGSAWGQPWVPPLPPEVRPTISETYANDLNGDRIDDVLQVLDEDASTMYLLAGTRAEREEAQAILNGMTDVKLIFNEPVTQRQIDDFILLGGELTYMYRALCFGWNGRLPLQQVAELPARMGPTLVLVEQPAMMRPCMDTATRIGRVRPVWKDLGYDGDPSITIAIIDSGVDGTHPDFAGHGRRAYWRDFSDDDESNPVDYSGHGSHVAGIAVGTGTAGGKGPSVPYYYTDIGDLTSAPSGNFSRRPIHLPSGWVEWNSTARWRGGGQESLYHVEKIPGDDSWYLIPDCTGVQGFPTLTLRDRFEATSDNLYSTALVKEGTIREYVITNEVTDPSGTGDQFNKFRGVAPACKWAGAKNALNSGDTYTSWTEAALADLADKRESLGVKVVNISSIAVDEDHLPVERQSLRDAVTTAVRNGMVVVVGAGNDADMITEAERKMADPSRTGLAITVGASNDKNAVTDYSTYGFANPNLGRHEDYKPDVVAPGGSILHYTQILSVDSDSANDGAFSDQKGNDYTSMEGTSMASPFVAGCAALVIDAMRQKGISWDFTSNEHPRYVKMVLCATATETNARRESGRYNPTLQRADFGPDGFPRGKDRYEGYGMINPDAAVEAVSLTHSWGASVSETLGPDPDGKRAWARTVRLSAGWRYSIELVNPSGCDFDLYLYSATPSSTGRPNLLDWSTSGVRGADEQIDRPAQASTDALLVVKRVSGTGRFQLRTSAQGTSEPSLMPLPEFIKTYSHSTMTRGYWFEAPTHFRITGLRVPDETGNGRQNVEVVRFNNQTPPPGYGDTTNNFVSLARFVNEPSSSILSVDIAVSRGDVIGILGAAGTSTMHSSYGQNNFVSNIGEHSVTLKRLGMRLNLYENPAQDLYHSSNELGRVEMWYIAD